MCTRVCAWEVATGSSVTVWVRAFQNFQRSGIYHFTQNGRQIKFQVQDRGKPVQTCDTVEGPSVWGQKDSKPKGLFCDHLECFLSCQLRQATDQTLFQCNQRAFQRTCKINGLEHAKYFFKAPFYNLMHLLCTKVSPLKSIHWPQVTFFPLWQTNTDWKEKTFNKRNC